MDKNFVLRLPLGESILKFNLEKAVCNHGFFMMAPNAWIPSNKSLQRPLRLADSTTSVNVSISQPTNETFLVIHVHYPKLLSLADQRSILEQVARMLRITNKDERDLKEFHEVHAEAKERGFGRLFRSPSLFEDVVKSLLLCNCTWDRTLSMARALCELQAKLTSTKKMLCGKGSSSNSKTLEGKGRSLGNFPSSREIANLKEDFLQEHCSTLGYRARYILLFAKRVDSGKFNLKKLEEASSCREAYKSLKKNKGFGPFACATVLMCIGFYQKVPIDTETMRHFQKVYLKESFKKGTLLKKQIQELYDKYAPFQSLAYWLELLVEYETKFGKLSELDNSYYQIVTGSK